MRKASLLLAVLVASAVITLTTGYYGTASAKEYPETVRYRIARHGIVRGIVYDDNNVPSAIVGREVVGQGSVINGVKVLRIHSDKVVFEKNLTRWTQRVDEQPNQAWSMIDLL